MVGLGRVRVGSGMQGERRRRQEMEEGIREDLRGEGTRGVSIKIDAVDKIQEESEV